MNGSKDLLREAADVLHEVDLAGLWPTHPVDVRAQTPECGPEACRAVWHLDARLDATVGELRLELGQQPGRGVVALAVVAHLALCLPGGDDEVARTIGGSVLRAVRVVLQFAVAPAGDAVDGAVADLVAPVVRVGERARSLVEFVGPHQVPTPRTGVRFAVVEDLDRDLVAGVLAEVPEFEAVGRAPVLTEREVAAEAPGWAGGLEDALPRPLFRERIRVAGCDLGIAQLDAAARVPEVRCALEVVQQVRIEGLVVDDGAGCLHDARGGSHRVGETQDDPAVAVVLRVVEGRQWERELARSSLDEGQGPGGRREVTVRGGATRLDRVLDGHLVRVPVSQQPGQLDCDVTSVALGDVEVARGEADGQVRDRGLTIETDVVDIVRPDSIIRVEGSQRPAMDLEPFPAVVRRVVAHALSGE